MKYTLNDKPVSRPHFFLVAVPVMSFVGLLLMGVGLLMSSPIWIVLALVWGLA